MRLWGSAVTAAVSLSLVALSAARAADNAKKSLASASVPAMTAVAPRVVARSKSAASTKTLRAKAQKAYPRTRFEKGQYFKAKGNLDAALIEFLHATQENPHLFKAYYEQALIFHQRGYNKLAQSSLEQCLAIKPDFQEARILLATIQIQQGNFGGAMAQLSRSLGLQIGNQPGRSNDTTPPKTRAEAVAKAPAVLQSLHMTLAEIPARIFPPQAAKPQPQAQPQVQPQAQPQSQKINFALRPYPPVSHEQEEWNKLAQTIQSNKITTPATPNTDADQLQPSQTKPARSLRGFWRRNKDNGGAHEKGLDSPASETTKNKGPQTQSDHRAEKQPIAHPPKEGRSWLSRLLHPVDGAPTSAESNTPLQQAQQPTAAQPEQEAHAIAVAAKSGNAAHSVPRAAQSTPVASALPSPLRFQPADPSEAPAPRTKPAFATPAMPTHTSALLAPLEQQQVAAKPPVEEEDEWTKRLKYLNEHGTASLKDGEAFMFSEDTGEASLFLADGQTIRRKIAPTRDTQEVVRQRRPDVLVPEDLMYNLSLLGKLMPRTPETDQSAYSSCGTQPTSIEHNGSNFTVDDLMGKSDGFWGWLKHVFKF